MAKKSVGGSTYTGVHIPEEPDRKKIAMRYAVQSTEYIVAQAREHLLIVTELAHGEEIGREFRAAVEARQKAIHAHEEAQKRMKLRKQLEEEMARRRDSRSEPQRDWHDDGNPSGPRKSFIRWFLGG